MQPITVALVGASHMHAAMHLRTLNLCPEVEAVIICDADAQAARQLRNEAGPKVTETTSDFDALLARGDAPVLFMMLRNADMPDACVAAAQAGKHIMAEKPMATNAADGLRVVKAVQEAGVVLSLCYPNVFNPVVRDMRRFVAAGVVGEVWNFELRMIASQVRFRDPSLWLHDKQLAGGGIVSWLACHYIDMVCHVLDDEVVSVMAMTKNSSGEPITVEDNACVILETACGAIGTLTAGYLLSLSNPGYEGGSYDTYFAVKGSAGGMKWEPFDRAAPKLVVESATPQWAAAPRRVIHYAPAQSDAYGGVFGLEFVRQFVRACAGEAEPPNTGADGLRVLRTLDAIYESSATGRQASVAPLRH